MIKERGKQKKKKQEEMIMGDGGLDDARGRERKDDWKGKQTK